MSTWVVMPSDDDVIHSSHKYIDKIMGKNGKWRYIYYRAKTKAKNTIGVGQKNRLERANRNVKEAEKNHEGSKYWTSEHKNSGDKEATNEAMKQNSKEVDNVQKAKRAQKNAQEAYNKTILGKLDSAIDTVKDAGISIWNKFTDLIDGTTKTTVTNKGVTKTSTHTNYLKNETTKTTTTTKTGHSNSAVKTQYNPSYKKPPTTANRGTVYEPTSGRTTGIGIATLVPAGKETGKKAATSFIKKKKKKKA